MYHRAHMQEVIPTPHLNLIFQTSFDTLQTSQDRFSWYTLT